MLFLVLACSGASKTSVPSESTTDSPKDTTPGCDATPVMPVCSCNLNLDWSAITVDKDGNSVSPGSFDYIRIEVYDLTPETLSSGLCAGSVEASRTEFQDLVLLSRTSMDLDVTVWNGKVLGILPLLSGHEFNTEWYVVDPSATTSKVILDGQP